MIKGWEIMTHLIFIIMLIALGLLVYAGFKVIGIILFLLFIGAATYVLCMNASHKD